MIDSNLSFDIPAVRGIQAGRVYFTMTPSMGMLKRLIAFDTGNVLQRSQRDVNKARAKKISTYIQNNKDNFVLPSLSGVVDTEMVEFIPSEVSDSVGLLRVSMDADIFLFDGQHRATGIINAVSEDTELRPHTIPVMLFTGMDLSARQQAFSDINGHTVKPSMSISDSYNKRDDLPMFVIEMARTIPAFVERVDFERNVVSKNSDCLFTVKILKDATAKLLSTKVSSPLTDEEKVIASEFWTKASKRLLWSAFKNWGITAEEFREQYISTHGVFLNALGLFGSVVSTQYGNFDKLDDLSNLNIKRESESFLGRCIDPLSRNMLTDVTANKLTAVKMLNHVGCPVPSELALLEKKHFPDGVPEEVVADQS